MERILGDFNRTMLTRRPTGKAVPGKEEVARGDNAEVDWTGLVWIPDSRASGIVML